MSSIITAAILFYFGSATIRGFALVLIIGVLVSMFTAVTLSRHDAALGGAPAVGAQGAPTSASRDDEFVIAAPSARPRAREASARV